MACINATCHMEWQKACSGKKSVLMFIMFVLMSECDARGHHLIIDLLQPSRTAPNFHWEFSGRLDREACNQVLLTVSTSYLRHRIEHWGGGLYRPPPPPSPSNQWGGEKKINFLLIFLPAKQLRGTCWVSSTNFYPSNEHATAEIS